MVMGGDYRQGVWKQYPDAFDYMKSIMHEPLEDGKVHSASTLAHALSVRYQMNMTRSAVIGKCYREGIQLQGNENQGRPSTRGEHLQKVKQARRRKRADTTETFARLTPKEEREVMENPGEGVPLTERTGCAYPVGWDGEQYRFCNRKQEKGAYCITHFWHMHVPA